MPTSTAFRTAPLATADYPPGLPYIIGNECAERFSFYGMRTVLVPFMTAYLVNSAGQPAVMPEVEAKAWYHQFMASAYFFPLFGALLSDMVWGKYRTIIVLSLAYCAGHLALALDSTRLGLFVGLGLIALGAGGIKPCVSAHVGDQFGQVNQHRLATVYGWFYFAINVGAMLSTLITPRLLHNAPGWLERNLAGQPWAAGIDFSRIGPHLAFGLPGLLMLIATLAFWLGRYRYAHIPPRGVSTLAALKGAGGMALLRLVPVYLCISVFWALYDQTGAAWVQQAKQMDRSWLRSAENPWHPEEIQAINPLLILLYIPLFNYVIYPVMGRFFPLTPLRRIGVGMILTALSFVLTAIIEQWIQEGHHPSIRWQILCYVILTAGEVLVSITGLEFSYTQAPRELKSIVMSVYLLSVSLGNQLTAGINAAIAWSPIVKDALQGAYYYWFFAGLMFMTFGIYLLFSLFYRGETQLQDSHAGLASKVQDE